MINGRECARMVGKIPKLASGYKISSKTFLSYVVVTTRSKETVY